MPDVAEAVVVIPLFSSILLLSSSLNHQEPDEADDP
jgi:hypothetical protein